ncbi:MAG TPA: amino acid adenylation domain-containing protein [Candidatus Polarisedimenticolia bacterium]|nr:amino acid adenylation domain-containing protein [Candidatus Polarisedimenticolia bacterium]
MHHIVSDGWSMGVLVREVAALYDAYAAGRPSPLPGLPIQVADFAAWQRAVLSGERLAGELAWWHERLTPLPPSLDLPADRPRPPVQSFRGGVERLSIPAEVAHAMRTLARREGATLFMGLLGAFDALLVRLTGEEDIAIGTGIANRTLPELEPLIGFFVNALVLRVSCSGDPQFLDLLRRARDASLGAFAHQDLPFERLVEELQPARDLSRNPIFQVAFALQNAPLGSFELPGLSIDPVPCDTGATRFDLEFHLWEEAEGGLDGFLFYSADLFDAQTIRRLADRYAGLLAAAVARPETRLSDLPVAAQGELDQATRVLARGVELPVPPRTAVELFEEQAARAPHAAALEQGERRLTYGELDAAAGKLAARLRAAGAGRESRVAILAERSIEQIIATLAVAKTGAAYVPLDPANPEERIEAMASRCGARIVLAPRHLAARAAAGGLPVLEIDGDHSGEKPVPRPAFAPEDLAYVIFTSGSTGEPNGVEVSQANLAALVAWHRSAFALRESDRATLIAGVGFDASVWELWPALASGACLLIPDERIRLDPAALRDWLVSGRATVAFLPTPLAEPLLALDWPRDAALRTLLVGGDRLHRLDPARLPFRVVNNYGPTEATVVATSGEADEGASLGMPTLGRPIANARTYVLDQRLRPVPAGVPGELHVAGAGIARGYAHAPDRTAERFIPDPYGGSGDRMYRTGDRVRQLSDGRLEFLGRFDAQVKIRGQRIEPAEVETTLATHPGVEAVAVVPRRENGETRLVAYVAPRRAGGERGRWQAEHIERWHALYDETYARTPERLDPTFNITGWNSSYTGEPIEAEQMREWRDRTVERILALQPDRVLEIGCGTGLLLTRIAPRCHRYVGTDFSRVALDLVRRAAEANKELGHVELQQRGADDFENLAPRSFDTIILNSVVQYFPDAFYLERVLEGALRLLDQGGRIFVGDVREARLQRAFAASVALHGATPQSTPDSLLSRTEQIVAGEEELLVDPAFFAHLAARAGRPAWAEARWKQGRADNELTRFRYDVLLHLGTPPASPATEMSWHEEAARDFGDLFRSGAPRIILRDVPNARVAAFVAAARALGEKREVDDGPREQARHPDDLTHLGESHGYAGVAALSSRSEDCFDLVFERGAGEPTGLPFPAAHGKPRRPLTNTPLRATLAGSLIAALRALAAARLPEAMVPAAFVVLDALPLTPNGKVDRRALPAPSPARSTGGAAPRTPAERAVARVWEEVLGVESVGTGDHFFDLGGHSLLATQVISRLRSALGVEVPLRAIFEAPTLAALAAFVEASAAPTRRGGAIPRLDRRNPIPLSFAQQRLWFIDRLSPGIAAYNIPNALRLEGDLDKAALGWTLGEILRRHEALRTRFVEGAQGAEQIVDPPVPFALPSEDLSSAADPEAEARRIVAAEALASFDLARGPLIRVRLLRLAPRSHVLSLVVHHIAADGWSAGVLVRELGAIYAAAVSGAAGPLPEPQVQYADWAAWQRGWLEGEELQRQLAYWKETLAQVEPLLLPGDFVRPAHPTYAGAALSVRLDRNLVERITGVAAAEGATLHMALLAAFAAVLARWSGQTDFAIGTPVAGRTREDTEDLVGFFVNTLALRMKLGGADCTYRELLRRLRETALGAYAHQEVPFERIVEEIRPERDTSRNPIFQALFALHNVPFGRLALPGLAIRSFEVEPATAQFDLEMSLFQIDGAVTGRLHWSTDLFRRDTMERLAAHFVRFVELAAADPGLAVRQAPILPETERRLLENFNTTQRRFVVEPTLARLFEATVDRRPEAPALRVAGVEVSYAALEARANRIAGLLIQNDVRRGDRVALCLERGVDRIAAVLATLKAGAAYVPLDPAYPAARLALMLEDAGAAALVTTEALAGTLPPAAARTLCLDREEETLASLDASRISVETSATDLTYVIYTSGSTGRPKGVAMNQGALLNLIAWQQERSGAPAGRRTLQYASLSFDASFEEIFSTFAEGGILVLISEDDRRDPAALLSVLSAEKVERLFVPFVALQSLAEAAEERGAVLALREVIAAGEQLRVTAPIRRLFGSVSGSVLDNQYGPSETHVATAERLAGDPRLWPELPTIGNPIANARAYVLDEKLALSPLGVVGEIYLGGEAVGRGYLDRADLTAERYLPDPFGTGERLYRTGDRGRVLADGRIEFLGRVDRQIKVRGYRVEPGEIESSLERCAGVRAAVVEARAEPGGATRLVAYVVPEGPLRGRVRTLRDELARQLPEYLVPSAFVELEALPLTPSGKVDRRALPEPELEAAPARGELSPWEAMVAGVFEETLGTHRLGRDAHFFALGGHSLLATKAVARLRRLSGVDLPLRAMFDAPTVRELAARLADVLLGERREIAPIPRAERGNRIAVSFQQERMWFLDRFEPGGSTYTMTAGLRLRGDLEVAALQRAIGELARRHEALRTRFEEEDGIPSQVIDPPSLLSLDPIDLSGAADLESELRERLEAEARVPFDLARGPLWRPILFRLGPRDHVLVVAMHHIVTDGWSMSVVTRELAELYEAYAEARPSPLAELPIQYPDYALWQRRWLEGGELERQLDYWRRRLEGVEPIDLPADRPRPALQSTSGARISGRIDADLAGRLRALARSEGATLNMVLLAGFALVLARWSGQRDFAVGLPVANRTQEETEGLIGFFVNTLALRLRLGEEIRSFRDLLAQIRESSLGAYAHQDVPFESLLAALNPRRDLSRTPVFQVWFNFVNVPEEEPRFGNLLAEPLGTGVVDAKFDLSLYVTEAGDSIDLDAVYSPGLFDSWRIREFIDQLALALAQAAQAPERPLEEISLVTRRARLELPDPRAPISDRWHGAVHDQISRRAAEHPAALAVSDARGAWSYGELEARSNQLANRLIAGGVRPGEVVAILAHRSAPTLWAILGVMKAGGAFTMLDPAHPPARLLACLQAARPRALIGVEAAGLLPAELGRFFDGTPCITLPSLDRLAEHDPLAGVSAIPAGVEVGPDDVACITFTSGSTGTPQGVRGRHGSLSHFQPILERRFGIHAGDRFSMLSGLAHDPLQRDLFTPLMAGAAVCIPDPDDLDSARLAAWGLANRVSVMNLTPAMAQILAGETNGGVRLPYLRLAFLLGEQLMRRDVERLRKLAPAAAIVNLYGTTETQRASACFVMPAGETLRAEDGPPVEREAIPAGAGMEDVQILIRNDGGRAAGLCEIGEIWVRSPHLALGYLDETLTADRFKGAGADRCYRTGDLGRYLAGGIVAVAGRRDAQVNVRGFRVETGEIEAALAAQPGVREVAVVMDGEGRLVGYLTPATGAQLDTSTLLQETRRRLPDYMVPAALVVLAALPLTPNGKVDRKALPEPAWGAAGGRIAPRTEEEEIACALFAEALGIEQVGAADSFFDLGGHSLLATRLLSRARAALGAEISLRALFESPTPAGLARSATTARRQGASLPPVRRAEDGKRPRLSYAQSRLWFLDRLQPDSAAYNVASAYRLSGDLDGEALGRALAEIERRHEALRTRFTSLSDRVEQAFDPPRQRVLETADLTSSADPQQEVLRKIAAEASRPFDLERGPLWRVLLLRTGAAEHYLSLVLHHTITDGWSMEIIRGELAAIYGALREGKESPLAELPIQYADWAAWQREWLEAGEMDRQLAYWRREMEGVEPLEIPTDRPRGARRGMRGASVGFEIEPETAASMARFARAEGATLFHVLLACFQALLARYAASPDVVVGIPIANRGVAEAEPVVGFFANTLAVRTRIDPAWTLRELVRRVGGKVLDAYAHQDVPFESIVEALDLRRDLSRNPLFDAMFVLQHVPASPPLVGDLSVEAVPADTGATPFDLTLSMGRSGERLFGSLVYDADLFEPATMERLLAHFAGLARALARDPGTRLEDLDLRTPEELAITETANATAIPRPPRLVHELFEEQVHRAASAVSVVDEERELSYAELDALANRIARRLRRLGVRPEAGVGLFSARTARSIAGMLGIFKSGGMLVPLDASLPASRLAAMLSIAGVRAVISERGLHAALAEAGLPILLLDADDLSSESAEPPEPLARPANTAYIIFTSGSTGEPKGVLVEHRAIADRIAGRVRHNALGPGERVLHFFSAIFDGSIEEILATLSGGATLIMHPDPRGETPEGFLQRAAAARLTVAHLPVGFLHELADDLSKSGATIPASLRILFTGGESPSGSRIAALLRAARGRLTVLNAYGPTEAVIEATEYRVSSEDECPDPVPIGRALDNTTVHLLDSRLRPVPIGAAGEIYIGGEVLSRGYAHRSAETAAAFLPDPFSHRSGARLYRTGDLARQLASGDLVFLGRRDGQVKLRGFRIELGEIEARLAGLEAVREAAVRVIGQGAAATLAAYVVPAGGIQVEAEKLRSALAASLPEYMVPSSFVMLPAMPRTATGKVDRRALPLPERAIRARTAPRDDLERTLARLWGDTLGGGGDDVEESFFQAGGNSLLAVRLVGTIRREIGAELPVAAVFREPTIAGLARLLRGTAAEASPLVTLNRGAGLPPLVCVHEVGGGIAPFAALAGHLDPRRPLLGLHAFADGPPESIEAAATGYAGAIARAVPDGPIDLLGWSYGGLVAYETALRLREAGRDVGTLVLLDAAAPGDKVVEEHPLARAAAMLWGVEIHSESAHEALSAARAAGAALPPELDGEQAATWLSGVAGRMKAADAYRPRPYAGKVVLVRGTESAVARGGDDMLGWQRFVKGDLALEWAPGSHHSIVRGEGARTIAAIVERHAAPSGAADA